MERNQATLTFEEVSTIRAAIRVGRVLAVLLIPAAAAAVPLALEAVVPVVGVALLTVFVLSPVLVTAVLILAAWQTRREQRQASA